MSDLDQKRARRFLVLQAACELSDGHAHKQFRQQDLERALGFSQEEVDALILYLRNEGLLSLHSLGRVYEVTDAGVTEYKTAASRPETPTRYFPSVNAIRNERMGHGQTRHNAGAEDRAGAGPAATRPAIESPNPPPDPDVSAPETTTETLDSAVNSARMHEIRAANITLPAVELPDLPPGPSVKAPEPTTKTFDSAVVRALVREIRSANITLSPTASDTLDSDLATVEAQLKRPQPMRSIISESFGSARTIVERAGEDRLARRINHFLLEMAMWDF